MHVEVSRVRDPHVLDDLGPLYHSYAAFGVPNAQLESFRVNQQCKEPVIASYIRLALAKVRGNLGAPATFAELFCADGYFTMLASTYGATESVGIDSNRDGFHNHAPEIARRLNLSGVRFECRDVATLTGSNEFDVVANIGGLYHVGNPIEILRRSYDLAKRYLIVQTVVSLAESGEEYFVTPAPGWAHGSRFSVQSFLKVMRDTGWRIIDGHFNQLEGNTRPEDRGSLYFLVEKATP